MDFRQKITLHFLIYITLCSVAFAQVVEIPDPNLRDAVREALNIAGRDVPLTQPLLRTRLTRLDAPDRGIADLTGLEFAGKLTWLSIAGNPITDFSPIAGLTNLETLYMWWTPISDISPLANLTNLRSLNAAGCDIVDISPLANLTQLEYVNLQHNKIADIQPLAGLTLLRHLQLNSNQISDVNSLAKLSHLEVLEIQNNRIADHSPLDLLSLDHFLYDQECDMPPLPLEARLENKTYPSPYAAEWTYGVDPRLDLVLGYILDDFGLHHLNDGGVVGIMEYAIQKRDELMATNPNMVFLVNISMRGAGINHYGEDWPYWIRDASGNIVPEGTEGAGLMDFTHSAVQDIIVEQAIAVSKCGIFDGIVFDWWHETGAILADQNSGWSEGYRGIDAEQRARDVILQRIRAESRPNFLIQVNSNRGKIPRTAPYINGLTMETGIPNWFTTDDALNNALLETESALLWAEDNLREPRINGVAGEALYGQAEDSPNNRRWARVLLTLSLTHANGYAVYQTHAGFGASAWIDLFDADLGRPVGPKAALYDEHIPGLYIREFTNGWAVYNHSGEVQVIALPEEMQGVSSGMIGTEHALADLDGEMYLRVKPKNPADVNGDGVVNILDLTLVAQGFGTDSLEGDVNGDGVVNVFDLVFVANQF